MRFMARNRAGKGILLGRKWLFSLLLLILSEGGTSYNTRQARTARFASAITAASCSGVGVPSCCWADDCPATSVAWSRVRWPASRRRRHALNTFMMAFPVDGAVSKELVRGRLDMESPDTRDCAYRTSNIPLGRLLRLQRSSQGELERRNQSWHAALCLSSQYRIKLRH